jgi:hypothetical protein
LCSSDFWIDPEIAYLVVGRCTTSIAFDCLDHGVEIVERGTPTLSLRSYTDAEIASRPLSVRILQ